MNQGKEGGYCSVASSPALDPVKIYNIFLPQVSKMSGCLDNAHCDCGIDLSEKRNGIASISAGVLFFVGWWLIIGNAATYPHPNYFDNAYYTCGVIGTLAFFMINAVSNSQVRGDAMTTGVLGTRGARLWLLIGFVLGFGALIASIWILFAAFVVEGGPFTNVTPGILLFLQNFFIFLSALLYKFGRTEDLWG